MTMRTAWIWPVLLLGFMVWAFLRYDFSQAVNAFHGIDWRLMGLSFGFNIGILYFRVIKWALVFKPINRVFSHFNLCLALFAGCLVNMVIPARAGGLVQAWIIGKKENFPVSTALGTVTLVRLFDSIMLIFLAVVTLILFHIPKGSDEYFKSVFKTAGTAGFFLCVLAVILFVFTQNQQAMDRLLHILLKGVPARFKPSAKEAATGFRQGLTGLNSAFYVAFSLLLSLMFWLLCAVNVWILIKALGLGLRGLFPPVLMLLAQAFSMGIPAPATAGPYHAATVSILMFYGISSPSALYAAVIMHGMMFISNTFPGLLYLWLDKPSLSVMLKGIKDARSNLR